jgi:hypothetical protein
MTRVAIQIRCRVAIRVRSQAQSWVKIRVSIQVRNRVRSYLTGKNPGEAPGQDKNVQDKETCLLRVTYIFVHWNIKFMQDRFSKEIKLNRSQIKGSFHVEGGDLKESEPRKISR